MESAACRAGDVRKVADILERENVSTGVRETTHGMRPLHLAALYGHANVARLLLDQGADLLGTGVNFLLNFSFLDRIESFSNQFKGIQSKT